MVNIHLKVTISFSSSRSVSDSKSNKLKSVETTSTKHATETKSIEIGSTDFKCTCNKIKKTRSVSTIAVISCSKNHRHHQGTIGKVWKSLEKI